MVDGANIGEMFEYHKDSFKIQLFHGADMVCLENIKVVRKSTPDSEGVEGYDIHGVFGNIVVSSFLPVSKIMEFYSVNSDKLMFSWKKPYILNGELIASQISNN